jgi:glycosyltransferase involved in cell wall biosynthesis
MTGEPNKKPRVSVIMNCRNGQAYLREAIDSVFAQSYHDWEIIFWDNASTDSSAAIARGYGEKLRYFKSDNYLSLGGSRNMALGQAVGKYIAFLDCDDKWLPDKLRKQVESLDSRPDIDFIYSNYYRLIMPDTSRLILGLKGMQPGGNVFGDFLCNYPVCLQTVMIRADAVERLDAKFDEYLEMSEEFDLFMRILLKSQALYIDEPLVIYRVHRNMSSQKLYQRHPVEMEYVLAKLKKIDHSIEKSYALQLKYCEAKLGYWKARVSMEKHLPESARSELAPYKFVTPVFFMLYFLTYMPPALWKWIHQSKMKGNLRWVS